MWLTVLAVLSVVAGLIVALVNGPFLYWLCLGLVSGVSFWSLSVITRAAEIYVRLHSESLDDEDEDAE